MEILAIANLFLLGNVAIVAWVYVRNPRHQRILWMICGFFVALTLAGLFVNWSATNPQIDLSGAAIWAIYIAGGLVVLAAIVAVLRTGNARFSWSQGRYARYRSYRRI